MFDNRRLFIGIFLLLVALHAGLILSQRLYPFVDLPNHLAAATILRYADQDTPLRDCYTLRTLFGPNTLHLVVCSQEIFPSVEVANRLLYAAYVILLPLALLLAIRRVGGNPWYALLAFPLLYNFNVVYGFSGFTLAIPLIPLLFAATVHYLERPGWAIRTAIAALFVLIFFAHGMAAQYALGLYGLVCLAQHWRRPLLLVQDAALALPFLAVDLVWWNFYHVATEEWSLTAFLSDYYRNQYLQTLPQRRGLFSLMNFGVFGGWVGSAVTWGISLAIIALCAASPRRLAALWARRSESRVACALLFLGFGLAAFFFLPDRIPDALYLYQRLAVFFFMAIILTGSLLHGGKIGSLRIAALTILALAHFALWADFMRDFDRENAVFTADLFAPVPPDEPMAALIADNRHHGWWPAYRHFGNYRIIWQQRPATTRIVEFAFGYVRRKVDVAALPVYSEWAIGEPEYDGRYAGMDYILTRGDLPDYVRAYHPNLAPVKTAGKWTLLAPTSE